MVRVVGVEIPDKKRLEVALTYVYGIGPTLARQIIQRLQLNPDERVFRLSQEEIAKLTALLQSPEYLIEGDLRRQRQNDVKRLIGIHCYRGSRHRKGLPVRGQRTRTNARTRKGPRRTVAGKKKAPQQ